MIRHLMIPYWSVSMQTVSEKINIASLLLMIGAMQEQVAV